MKMRGKIEKALSETNININGNNPWDPHIYNDNVFAKVAHGGSIALGESFMAKEWDVDDLAELVCRVQKASIPWYSLLSAGAFLQKLKALLFNLQTGSKAYEVGEKHYDLGNDLYEVMLDRRMIYTAAYWDNAVNLDEAQEAKLDLICRKLDLQPGQRVLDIGCGWGGFMKYAAEKYGVSCVGLSVSKKQISYGEKSCTGLPIEFVFTDYQTYIPETTFDHIVSIEMFEAVGPKNYRTYMNLAHSWLKDGGAFLLQTITSTLDKPKADPWIDKYIFPNGALPNKKMIEQSVEGLFSIADWQSLGKDYDKTLMAWWDNFDKAYPTLNHDKYDEKFYRMWKYYIQTCAGGFRSGHLDDWQVLLKK